MEVQSAVNGENMQSIVNKLKTYLNPEIKLRIGAIPVQNRYRYVVTAIDNKENIHIVSYGDDITKLWYLPPVAVHTALTDIKVSFVKDELRKEEVGTWLDRNEERIIPPGFTSDQIINEWDVQENTIYSATVTKDSFEGFKKNIPVGKLLFSSISVPLWDFALLYSRYISGPFVIWKITDNGSVLGYVKEGALHSLCNIWPDYDDIHNDAARIGTEISALIKTLTKGDSVTTVVPCSDRKGGALPSEVLIPGYTLASPPEIGGLPAHFHETYACSLHKETNLDFARFADKQKMYALEKKRHYFLKGLKCTAVSLAGVALVLLLGMLSITCLQKYTERKIEPLQLFIAQIEKGEHRLDSLKSVYLQKASFLGRESIVTFLMNELQQVFPDGTWAQHIEITEAETNMWHINTIALAYSTALIPRLLSNMEAVMGISNVRMIYSEQTSFGGKRAIKLKIECNWDVKK